MFGNAAATSNFSSATEVTEASGSTGTTDLSDWTIDPPPEKALDLVFVR